MPLTTIIKLFFLFNFLILISPVRSQHCAPDFYSVNYQTPTVQYIAQTAITADNNIDIGGYVLRSHSVLIDAMLTRVTKQGTVLWSRGYSSSNYDYVQFLNILPLTDGSIMVNGMLATVDTSVVPPAILASTGFLARLDKYGTIQWTKLFDNIFSPGRMITLKNGNILMTLAGRKDVANTIMLCFDDDGNTKWSNTLKWRDGDAPGKAAIHELRDGSVIIAQNVNVYSFTDPSVIPKNGYYLMSLNSASGLKQWDKFFWYNINGNNGRAAFADIAQITEFGNGNISCVTSMADTSYYQFRKTTSVVNIITDKSGRLISVLKYTPDNPPLYASDAKYIADKDQLVFLMDNADAPQLLCTDAQGKIIWQHAYPKVGRSQETTSLIAAEEGLYFFCFTHNGGSTDFTLTKTDPGGNAACVQSDIRIYSKDITGLYSAESGDLQLNASQSGWYSVSAISRYDYKMQSNVKCRQTCCTDVINSITKIDLCNADSYTLPNNDVVTKSGTYALTYKTSKGCDSIVYHDVTFSLSPEIELGVDKCFGGKDSLLLKVNIAYNSYKWNGIVTAGPYYVVKKPGTYWVSVTNACGTKSDTTRVFEQCEFSITMPNAFTPNHDGKNDIFRIPAQVNNRLVRFIIYNRWGQVVYTSSSNEGWDGSVKGNPAPVGTYVYVVEMETLDNKKRLSQKGWVNLLR